MYKYTNIRNIIGMVILNMEIIDGYRRFQNLVLNFLDNDIFAIDEDKNVTGTEMDSFRPTLDRRVERVCRCSNDLFAADKHMNKFICLVDVCFNDFLECNIPGLFIPCPDLIAGSDSFDGEPWDQ